MNCGFVTLWRGVVNGFFWTTQELHRDRSSWAGRFVGFWGAQSSRSRRMHNHNGEREGFPIVWSSVPWHGPGPKYKLARRGKFCGATGLRGYQRVRYTKVSKWPWPAAISASLTEYSYWNHLSRIPYIITSSCPLQYQYSRSMHRRRSG